jgi:mono/diheme cytochrome c family protein
MNDRRNDSRNQPRNLASGRPFTEDFSDGKLTEVHSQLSREKEEPHEGFAGIPVFIVFVFCAFGFWAGVYLSRNSAGFSASTFDLDAVKVVADSGPKAFEPDAAKGEKLFAIQCASCHQVTGLGQPGVYPPLAGSEWVAGDESRIIKIILAGLVGEIQVKGATYNNNMPNIGAGLKDSQVANIATYVRQAWGNTAAPIMDTKVAEIRKSIGARGQYSPKEVLSEHPLAK